MSEDVTLGINSFVKNLGTNFKLIAVELGDQNIQHLRKSLPFLG
jgi:hypothetical protein